MNRTRDEAPDPHGRSQRNRCSDCERTRLHAQLRGRPEYARKEPSSSSRSRAGCQRSLSPEQRRHLPPWATVIREKESGPVQKTSMPGSSSRRRSPVFSPPSVARPSGAVRRGQNRKRQSRCARAAMEQRGRNDFAPRKNPTSRFSGGHVVGNVAKNSEKSAHTSAIICSKFPRGQVVSRP